MRGRGHAHSPGEHTETKTRPGPLWVRAASHTDQVLKYLASGWYSTNASVDCSGCSWSSSDSSTPILSG